MHCRDCRHFLPSVKADQRASMAGWGYCTAAPKLMGRAQFFPEDKACWIEPAKFTPKVAQ